MLEDFIDLHLTCLYIFDKMSKTQRKIAVALLRYLENQILGKYKIIFPSFEQIAKEAGCSRRSVAYFIKKYNKILFDKIVRINKGKQTSNEYRLNRDFFEFLWLMRENGFIKRWDKDKKKIEAGISETAHFLCSKLRENGRLSTMLLHSTTPLNLHPINSFLSYEVNMKKVPRTGSAIKMAVQRKAFEEINSLPLSFSEKERLSLTFSILSLRAAKEDLVFYQRKNKVSSAMGFMFARAKAHTAKHLNL